MPKKSTQNNLATKTDLKKLATKIDLKGLRSELRSTKKSLWHEILRVEESLENKIDKNKDDLMIKLDGIAGALDDLRTDNKVGTKHTRELRVQVDNHEARITTLESI